MSKRARADTSASEQPAKRRKVKLETYKKWVKQYDSEFQTVSWLDCETSVEAGSRVVTELKCRVCARFRSKIIGKKNFSDKWINGAKSVRTTNVVDHAKSDQHTHAMNLHRWEKASSSGASAMTYAPIVRALNTLSQDERKMLANKFDIAHFVASEHLSFSKYAKICKLEARHGVDVGSSYLHRNACRDFVHSIAESKRHTLLSSISKANFFSLLMDGSTDQCNVDNQLD